MTPQHKMLDELDREKIRVALGADEAISLPTNIDGTSLDPYHQLQIVSSIRNKKKIMQLI